MVYKAARIAHLDFEAVASVASAASGVTAVHSGSARSPVTGRGVRRDRWRGRARQGARRQAWEDYKRTQP
jgi:hypothetical protein